MLFQLSAQICLFPLPLHTLQDEEVWFASQFLFCVPGNDVYKLYYSWPAWQENSDTCSSFVCSCYRDHYTLETPKLFNIADDPSETEELNISLPEHASIVAKIKAAVNEHEESTANSHPPQMTVLAQIGRPWNHPFCAFPSILPCKDDTNALNYQYKYYNKI